MQPQQPGYGGSRTYLEVLAELPWQISSEEQEIDLVAAKEQLDSEHYGLAKVKKRIIEYLAVRKVSSMLFALTRGCRIGCFLLSVSGYKQLCILSRMGSLVQVLFIL
jgi:ATP-dependent Lon protease